MAIEAAAVDGWYKYVGLNGEIVGVTRFGESGSAPELFEYFSINCEAVLEAVDKVIDLNIAM